MIRNLPIIEDLLAISMETMMGVSISERNSVLFYLSFCGSGFLPFFCYDIYFNQISK